MILRVTAIHRTIPERLTDLPIQRIRQLIMQRQIATDCGVGVKHPADALVGCQRIQHLKGKLFVFAGKEFRCHCEEPLVPLAANDIDQPQATLFKRGLALAHTEECGEKNQA